MDTAKRRTVVVNWRQWLTKLAQHLLVIAIGAGCAFQPKPMAVTKESSADARNASVKRLAEERWQALIKGDLDAAYAYLSPASRTTLSLDLYKKKHRLGFYRGVTVKSTECEVEVCTVKLALTYDTKDIKGIVTPITERWIIDQGKAWYVEQG